LAEKIDFVWKVVD